MLMALQLEVGKKYWTRDGRVAFVEREHNGTNSSWPFEGRTIALQPENLNWSANGRYGTTLIYPEDLVAEYQEPDQPAFTESNTLMPRVWGVYCSDNDLLGLFWNEAKAKAKMEIFEKDHPYAAFWVEEVIVS